MNMLALALLISTGLSTLAAIGVTVLMLAERRRANSLAERLQASAIEIASMRERVRNLEDSRTSMAEFLRAEAAQSAQAVAEQMVVRASETFHNQQQIA